MVWVVLVIAGLFEIGGAVALKFSQGFTRIGFSILTVALFVVSFILLSRAATILPIGTAYAVWTGIGAAGIAVVGMIAFKESRSPLRLISLGLVIIGSIGVKLAS